MIISNKKAFVQFWDEAKDKTFEEQLPLWDQLIESPDQPYFERYVHGSQMFPDWREKKRSKAQTAFAEYPLIYESMIGIFDDFEKVFSHHLARFKSHFPDFILRKLDLRIIANSKRFLATSAVEGSRHYLSFSVDFMASLRRDPLQIPGVAFALSPEVLYAHELFHVYQEQEHPLRLASESSARRLIGSLWAEGLAVYVSGLINPEATIDELLAFEGIHPVYVEHTNHIHRCLLRDLEDVNPGTYTAVEDKWKNFSERSEKVPFMAGYAIGYALVVELCRTYSLETLLRWEIERIEVEFRKFLTADPA